MLLEAPVSEIQEPIGRFKGGFPGPGMPFREGKATAVAPPPLVGQKQEIMPTRNHVPEGQTVQYNTTPPTSGDHWPRWANCGFYQQGLPDELIVHNLEHGHIVVSYNLATLEQVNLLRAGFRESSFSREWGVARFYDKISAGTVVVTAWGGLDTMNGIDLERIETFFKTYAGGLGPEKIPC